MKKYIPFLSLLICAALFQAYAAFATTTFTSDGSYSSLSDTPQIPEAQIQSDWGESTNSAYDYIKNKPLMASRAYTSYQAFLSQSGTGAPVATEFNNDLGATFTWARTGAGTYTITASAAVFTSGKTAIIMSNPPNPLWNFKYTVSSSTVVTINTSILSIITLILTPTGNDNMLSNTLLEIRVYQ